MCLPASKLRPLISCDRLFTWCRGHHRHGAQLAGSGQLDPRSSIIPNGHEQCHHFEPARYQDEECKRTRRQGWVLYQTKMTELLSTEPRNCGASLKEARGQSESISARRPLAVRPPEPSLSREMVRSVEHLLKRRTRRRTPGRQRTPQICPCAIAQQKQSELGRWLILCYPSPSTLLRLSCLERGIPHIVGLLSDKQEDRRCRR